MKVLEETLEETLDGIEIAARWECENLTMFPLLGGRLLEPDYLTLDEALQSGKARITEISEGGSVPELCFANAGEQAVLLLDGEELIGAKQNRILNLTILAPAQHTFSVPVSCVEMGRWSYASAEFGSAARTHYAAGRAKKNAAVTESLRTTGSRHSNQGEVWQDIAEKSARLEAASPTHAMAAMYESHAADLEQFVRALPATDGQAGAAFAINGSLVGLDLFDCAATLRKLLPKLVRSYALDAVDARRAGRRPALVDDVSALLREVHGAGKSLFPAVGEGEDVRLAADGLTGGALVARGRVVHLSAFRLETAERQAQGVAPTRISRPSARRGR